MRNYNLSFIRTALEDIGAPVPEVFTRTAADVQKITEAHQNLTNSRTIGYNTIADAWANAVLDDRDPSTDPGIIAALVASALADGDVGYAASNIAEGRLIDQLPALLPSIMGSFKKAVAEANKTLTKAHEILGNTALGDVHTIHELGPAALQASIEATEAARIIRVIDNAWRALAETTHFARPDTPVLLRLTDADIEQWEQLRNVKDAWVFVQNGLTLDLATTADEVQRRQEHVDNTRAEREAARAQSDKTAIRNSLR